MKNAVNIIHNEQVKQLEYRETANGRLIAYTIVPYQLPEEIGGALAACVFEYTSEIHKK